MTLVFLFCLTACAGYRFQEKSNPFERYGIRSVQIPMFYNHSSLPNVSAPFTKEFKNMLYKYRGLRITTSDSEKVDAVLIGIIDSPRTLAETIENQTLRVADSVAGSAVGEDRRDFYVPGSSRLTLSVRLILIKNPTPKEIKVLQSEFGKYVQVDSKVLIHEKIQLSESFNREIYDGQDGNIHYTQNQGAIKSTIDLLAMRASESFRSLILYAF